MIKTQKLDVISDLHFDLISHKEVEDFYVSYQNHLDKNGHPDVLVIAGDIASYSLPIRDEAIQKLDSMITGRVVHVPGNHDFWHAALSPTQKVFEIENVNDCKYLTGTGWFDADSIHFLDKRTWVDFKYIGDYPYDAMSQITQAHKAFLWQLEKSDADILVTHHFPVESTHPRWMGMKSNHFFSSENFTKSLVKAPKLPKLWIHGHTHDPMDYIHPLGFRVYCNPSGYAHEGANMDFWDRIRIEVDIEATE
jgi:Icc-related predicted phosphoesterase